MTSDNERKLRNAEAYLGIASGLLQEVIDSEWRDMDDSDCETEAMIDNLESICEAVRKQQSQLFSINIGISTEAIRRSFPNTLRMLEDDYAIVNHSSGFPTTGKLRAFLMALRIPLPWKTRTSGGQTARSATGSRQAGWFSIS